MASAIAAYLMQKFAWLGSTRLGQLFAKYIAGKLTDVIVQVYQVAKVKVKQWWRGKEQEKAKEEFDKVQADPNATADDRGKAYEKNHNSGR